MTSSIWVVKMHGASYDPILPSVSTFSKLSHSDAYIILLMAKATKAANPTPSYLIDGPITVGARFPG